MFLENLIPEALFNQIGWVIVHFAWQASLIALVTGIILFTLQRANANTRYIICCLALIVMIILPICTFMSNSHTTIQHYISASTEELSPIEKKDVYWNGQMIGTQHRSHVISLSRWKIILNHVESNLSYITLGWFIGIALISTYRLIGFARLNGLIRKTRMALEPLWERKILKLIKRLNINQKIRIFQSPHIDVPAVIGWFKPILLVPVSFFTGMDNQTVESIIVHELAHIKRYDYLVNLIQMVIETLGFFHPAVWWLSKRIRTEREHCCDDWAVQTIGDKLIYVKSLVLLEETKMRPKLIVAANGSDLFKRVTRILNYKTRHNILAINYMALLSFSVLSLLFLAGFTRFQFAGNNSGSVYSIDNLNQGLVAYYPFNGNANDQSGYAHHGVVKGAVLTTDRFGKAESAYRFDGENDLIFVKSSELLNIAGSLTVSCWICPHACNDYDAWLSKANLNDRRSQWRAGFGEDSNLEWGLTEFTLVDTSNIWMDYWLMGNELEFDTWVHVTIVADQKTGRVRLYKNGQKMGEMGNIKPFIVSNDPLYIGYQREENAFFNGMIDDVRIYNDALDDGEVLALYHVN